MNGFFKIAVGIGLLAVVLGGGYFGYRTLKYAKEDVPAAVDINMVSDGESVKTPGIEAPDEGTEEGMIANPSLPEEPDEGLPKELNLKLTFYSQAPFGNWDYPWQEACEEASVLLVANEYFGHDWTAEEFNDEILKLVAWENETFGHYEHTSVNETVKILNEYLGLETVIHEDPSFEDIQRILNRGHFIVMTFAGKKLGNPFYKNGGPVYHAMVIKGYKEGEKIITNDVGTRRGENYVYSWKTVFNAMHDYAVPIEAGAKRMIEVIPPKR